MAYKAVVDKAVVDKVRILDFHMDCIEDCIADNTTYIIYINKKNNKIIT
jgi:hypothetical protein